MCIHTHSARVMLPGWQEMEVACFPAESAGNKVTMVNESETHTNKQTNRKEQEWDVTRGSIHIR